MAPKYIVVTGGVVSGLGKGVTASSLGVLLKACGYTVTAIKIDPYLNADAGTISPFEHGEVFVLDDGAESDLDLGNYERFLDVTLARDNNITTGKVYQHIIQRERRGDYLGKTVQVVPHVSDAIQDWIEEVANRPIGENGEKPDICVVELGGTIGDIESMPFVEALRQFQFRVGMCLVHVSLVPALGQEGEQKTKPTQHSMHSLRSLGLSPDMLACRSTDELDSATKEKLALFCHVQPAAVLNLHDVSNIWKVPVLMQSQGALEHIGRVLGLDISTDSCHLERWQRMATRLDHLSSEEPVRIGMVGKYTHLGDSYLSVSKALMHAGVHCGKRVKVDLIESSNLESGDADSWEKLKGCDGILIPGGFGERGIEGKVSAARHARLTNKPFLGICLGMQIAVIEHVRAQLKNEAANSTEFDPDTPCPAVIFMPEQEGMGKGGTMRLGSRETTIVTEDCASFLLYGSKHSITERHRHRYEVNPEMVPQLEDVGLRFVATDMSGKRMEIVESRDHPFFVGCQFHPEFKSRPGQPAPLFLGLVLAAQSRLQDFLSDLGLGFNPTLSGSPFNSKAAPMAPDVADGPNRDDAL